MSQHNINYYINKFKHHFDRFSSKNSWLYNTLRVILWIAFGLGVIFTLFFFVVYLGYYGRVPYKDELKEINNYVASEVYSSDGELLGKFFIENRTTTTGDKINENIKNALIATEDVRFHNHKGIDLRSIFRVIFKTLIGQDESSGGGSTITQQLAKNLYPRRDYGIMSLPINKMQEMIIAYRLEHVYSKEEILTLYLNTVSFGENNFGIETATNRYFSKSPSQVSLEEAAVLIGMLKATTYFNPRMNPTNSRLRRNVVINQLNKYDYISDPVADSLMRRPLGLNYSHYSHMDGKAPYFREFLRHRLNEWAKNNKKPDGSNYNIYTDGLKIYTTIDSRMQQYAEESVFENMKELQEQFDKHWSYRNIWKDNADVVRDAMLRSERYRVLKNAGLSADEIKENFNDSIPMNIFKYEGEVAKYMSPLDSIKHFNQFLNAGFIALEPSTGYVKAYVGGIDYKFFRYDQIMAARSVGSTFKPIVYASAIENGISPCDRFGNYKTTFTEWDNWSPSNADDSYGGSYSLGAALTNSVNVVSVKLIIESGINNAIQLARNMGISTNLPPYPSIALGVADIPLYEMVGAYTTFANRGIYSSPVYLLKIEDNNGNIIEDFRHKPNQRKALSTQTAEIMTSLLEDVVNEGTGRRIRWYYKLDNDVAGKTGTTQNHSDGWFIGYTPRLVAGARVGAQDQRVHFRTISLGQGAKMALPIWGTFMKKLSEDSTYVQYVQAEFPEPSDEIKDKLNCPGVVYYGSSSSSSSSEESEGSGEGTDANNPFFKLLRKIGDGN